MYQLWIKIRLIRGESPADEGWRVEGFYDGDNIHHVADNARGWDDVLEVKIVKVEVVG